MERPVPGFIQEFLGGIDLQIFQSIAVLATKIEGDPGFLIGPIAFVIGQIINFLYGIIHSLTDVNTLGISIIFLTIIVRTLMLPLAFKQQKSTSAMQKVQPEVEKIKAKYEGQTDPEAQRKMNMEIQTLYSKNKVNIFGGCLPMLVTLPIFFALTYVMRQPYLFIPDVTDVYKQVGHSIQEIPNWLTVVKPAMIPLVQGLIKPDMLPSELPNIENIDLLIKGLNLFKPEVWESLRAIAPDGGARLNEVLVIKAGAESFFGINLINTPSLSFPSILIPALSGITQFFTFWIMEKTNPSAAGPAQTQQTVMKFVMPVMMIVFTMQVSSGVGLYWTVSNVYQLFQQYFLNKYYRGRRKDKDEIIDAEAPKKEIVKLVGKKKVENKK